MPQLIISSMPGGKEFPMLVSGASWGNKAAYKKRKCYGDSLIIPFL
jgi:hypothetical protein